MKETAGRLMVIVLWCGVPRSVGWSSVRGVACIYEDRAFPSFLKGAADGFWRTSLAPEM